MDRRSWLWRRKSSEKSPGETESSGGSISSHSERFSDDQIYSTQSFQSPEVTSKAELQPEELEGSVKTLSQKLSEALVNISIKEDLVKQHSKVAEEAVEGHPTVDKWPTLANLPHWQSDQQHIQGHKYDSPGLYSVVHLSPKNPAYDLLCKMLEYDPRKRITAAQALDHEYFRMEPLPGRNSLVSPQPGEKVVNYPIRPVDTNTDFEGTASLQPAQQASGNQMSGGAHVMASRNVGRPVHMVGGMQRMQQQQNMTAYNLASQAAMGSGGAMNPANIPMQRGVAAQPHQQQQQQLRRKDGMGMPGYPQQKSRRF